MIRQMQLTVDGDNAKWTIWRDAPFTKSLNNFTSEGKKAILVDILKSVVAELEKT